MFRKMINNNKNVLVAYIFAMEVTYLITSKNNNQILKCCIPKELKTKLFVVPICNSVGSI